MRDIAGHGWSCRVFVGVYFFFRSGRVQAGVCMLGCAICCRRLRGVGTHIDQGFRVEGGRCLRRCWRRAILRGFFGYSLSSLDQEASVASFSMIMGLLGVVAFAHLL